jgi:hypothetical protein
VLAEAKTGPDEGKFALSETNLMLPQTFVGLFETNEVLGQTSFDPAPGNLALAQTKQDLFKT